MYAIRSYYGNAKVFELGGADYMVRLSRGDTCRIDGTGLGRRSDRFLFYFPCLVHPARFRNNFV